MSAKLLVLIALALAALGAWWILQGPMPSPSAPRRPTEAEGSAQTQTKAIAETSALAPPLRESGEARTYVVLMRVEGGRFAFDPAALFVQPGDEVLWVNLGDNHSTTAYHPQNGKELRIPEGAEPWDSGILGFGDAGITFSYTFRVEGTYDYFCLPHEFLGMVGRVVAGNPGGPAETTPLMGLPAAVQEGMPSTARALTGVGAWAAEINRSLWLLLQGDQREAARQAAALLEAYLQGENRPGSLYWAFEEVGPGRADDFARLLREFRDRLEAGVDFREAELRADRLKALLLQAEETLLQ